MHFAVLCLGGGTEFFFAISSAFICFLEKEWFNNWSITFMKLHVIILSSQRSCRYRPPTSQCADPRIHGNDLDMSLQISHQDGWVDIYLNNQRGRVHWNVYVHILLSEVWTHHMQKVRFRDDSADVGWYRCNSVTWLIPILHNLWVVCRYATILKSTRMWV